MIRWMATRAIQKIRFDDKTAQIMVTYAVRANLFYIMTLLRPLPSCLALGSAPEISMK